MAIEGVISRANVPYDSTAGARWPMIRSGLIAAVDALGRVARGESGPRCDKQKAAGSSERHHDVFHCDPPGLDYDQINNRAQSRLRTPR